MAVIKTIISVASTDTEYTIPGDWSAEQIKTNYANDIPGIASMQYEEKLINVDGGQAREITFKPRTGTKG
jgi:hypothetical protein